MFVLVNNDPKSDDIEQDGLETFCDTVFATCTDTRRFAIVRSKLALMLDPRMLIDYRSPHEFSFEVQIVYLDEPDQDFATQDRFIVRRYVGDDCASVILPIVLRQLALLVMTIQPPIKYRVTKMRSPDAKALGKHDLLTETIEGLGYSVLECAFDAFSRAYWVMERVAGHAG